eukprot:4841829-Amphidinium_carterae.1
MQGLVSKVVHSFGQPAMLGAVSSKSRVCSLVHTLAGSQTQTAQLIGSTPSINNRRSENNSVV